jgi:hypothetical protein
LALTWCALSLEASAASKRAGVALPSLEVTSTPRAPEDKRATPAPTRARGAALALNSLSEGQRRALAEALDRVAAQLEARRNPFYAPLDDDATRAEIKALLVDVAPSFSAAETLAAGRWTSPEGDVTVRLVGTCAAGAACFPLAKTGPRGDVEDRARFLAWPVGFAALAKARDARDAARIAASVRAAREKDSRIALVLCGAELHRVHPSPALTALRTSARRVLRAGGDSEPAMARLLGSITDVTRADDLAWLSLPPEVLLIVPRLGALATADAFVQEVARLLGKAGGEATWLGAPGP